ncbi:hypothetical protein [Gemmatimonas sp.]|uniref:hypothetical protein n=1 Tax=Gemmatimonas sp. TaxID=1962908 RepID=UPI0037C0A2A6
MLRPALTAVAAIACFSIVACRGDSPARDLTEAEKQAAHVKDVVAAGGTVDSIIPVAEALQRFRADLPKQDTLSHASASRGALVQRLAAALMASDTSALNAMVLSRAEFAWLFYEDSPLSRPPYEAPPALLWSQILVGSDDGARQLVNRLGGKTITVSAFTCPNPPEVEGRHTLHKRCTVRFSVPGEKPLEGNLFGSIIERDGRFKFIGLGNRI